MIKSPIIAIIFEWINFGLVIFAIIYLFKKYLLKLIYSQISQEQNHTYELEKELGDISSQIKLSKENLYDQQEAYSDLYNNLKKWHRIILAKKESELNFYKINQEKLSKKLNKKIEIIELNNLKNKSYNLALLEAKTEIAEKFNDNKLLGLNYQDKVIKDLN